MATVLQVSKELFVLAKELAQLFYSLELQPIKLSGLSTAYAKHFHKNLSLKEYNITSSSNLVEKVPIFSYADKTKVKKHENVPYTYTDKNKAKRRVLLNWKKLLEFFFIPVLESVGRKVPVSSLPRAFKQVTGVDIQFLYELFDIEENASACDRLATAVSNESTTFCLQTYPGIGGHFLQLSSPSVVDSKTTSAVLAKAAPQSQPSAAAVVKIENTTDKQLTPQPQYGTEYPQTSVSPKPNKRSPGNISTQDTETRVPMMQPTQLPLSQTPDSQAAQLVRYPLLPRPHSRFAPPDMSTYAHQSRVMPQLTHDRDIPHTQGLSMSSPMQDREVLPHMQDRGMSSSQSHGPTLSATMRGHEVLPHMQDRGRSQPLSPAIHGHVISPHMQGASFLPLSTARPMVKGIASGSTVNINSPEHHTTSKQQQNLVTTSTQKFPNPHLEIDREILLPAHCLYRPELTLPKVDSSKLVPPPKKKAKKSETKEDILEGINSKLGEVIEELSAKGKFVPVNFVRDVMHEIVREVNYARYPATRINWRDVKAMEEYSKVHGRVDELIKIFSWFNPITSLYELEQALILSEKVSSFEELHMGPLLKHPLVRNLFQPADDLEEIPKISGFKIRKYLMDFLSRRPRGEKKSTIEDFLEFVRMKESKDTINHLCIRVTSYSLAIQVSKLLNIGTRVCSIIIFYLYLMFFVRRIVHA